MTNHQSRLHQPRPHHASRAARFAQGVMARHRHATRLLARLELPLALRARPLVLHRHAGPTLNTLALTLPTVVLRPALAQPLARGTAPAALPLPRGAMPAPSSRGASATPAPLHMPLALQRIAARSQRVDGLAAAPTSAAHAMPVTGRATPAVRPLPPSGLAHDMPTVLRAAPAPARAGLSNRHQRADEPAPQLAVPALRPQPAALAAQGLPPHEIERITERVLGSIDRRILAERERRGGF